MAEKGGPEETNNDDWIDQLESSEATVFYPTEDEYRVSKTILRALKERGIKCFNLIGHINAGKNVPLNTAKAIQKSRKTIIILSKKSAAEICFSLETYLSLEQSIKRDRMTLIILLIDGLTVEDVPKIPILQHACQMILVDNLHEMCIEQICSLIRQDIRLTAVLPAGNFSTGMAWSHFTGYLRIILPDLFECIKKSDFFGNNIGKMSTCFFMLCPYSARAPKRMSDGNPDIEYVGNITIEREGRTYTPSVYKVRGVGKDGNKEEFLCCAEYPSALCALGFLEEALHLLSPKQRRLEVERFKYKLEEILNHSNNQACTGRVKIITFDDLSKDLQATASYQLHRAVKEAIIEGLGKPLGDVNKLKQQLSTQKTDVCILFTDTTSERHLNPENEDPKLVRNVRGYLEQHGLKCSIARPPTDPNTVIQERMESARWIIILISQKSFSEPQMVNFWLAQVLNMCIDDNEFKILILLSNVNPSMIPDFIQWVTYIDISLETDYKDKVLQIVNGGTVSLASKIPAGDVSFGLAWAFHINYLRHVLPDFRERVERKMNSNEMQKLTNSRRNRKVSKYFLQLVPKSCKIVSLLSTVGDNRIQGPYETDPIVRTEAGTENRKHPCHMYKIDGPSCDYFFAGEMLRPLNTLLAMKESVIAGLNQDQMYEQKDQMVEQLNAILDTDTLPKELQKKCKLITYDDTKENMVDVIMDFIDREDTDSWPRDYGRWLQAKRETK